MFKKARIGLICAALSISFFSCTVNKPAEEVRFITVSGTGTATQKPDFVSLKFLVRNIEWNVNTASQKNADATAKVIDAVKKAGVDAIDISTIDYKITQDNSNNYPGRYTVVNTISVLVRNRAILGNIIDAAIVNGANGLTGFDYVVSDKSTSLRTARTEAVKNAQNAATLIAGASGCKVDSVLNITENTHYSSATPSVKENTYSDTALIPGEENAVSIVSEVTITYSLTVN